MIKDAEEFVKRGVKLREVKKINDLSIENKYSQVIIESLRFIEKYGSDFLVNYCYGFALRKKGFFTESIEVLEDVLNNCDFKDKTWLYENTKVELFKSYYMNNDFEKAYKMWDFSYEILKKRNLLNVENIGIVIKTKLAISVEPNTCEQERLIHQLTKYNKNLSLDHIKLHLPVDEEDEDVKYFADDIDVDKIFDMVTKNISTSRLLPIFSIRDIYLFHFNNIGKNEENVLKVVTNKGTNEIITMYPDFENELHQEFINYNLYDEYLCKKESKVKRLSQIDKFKNRFSR